MSGARTRVAGDVEQAGVAADDRHRLEQLHGRADTVRPNAVRTGGLPRSATNNPPTRANTATLSSTAYTSGVTAGGVPRSTKNTQTRTTARLTASPSGQRSTPTRMTPS